MKNAEVDWMKGIGRKKSPQNGMEEQTMLMKNKESKTANKKKNRIRFRKEKGTENTVESAAEGIPGKKLLFKKRGKMKKRTIIIIIVSVTVTILGVVAAAIYFWPSSSSQRQNFPFGNMMQGGGSQFAMTEDMVTASGVTSVGVTEDSFDVENLTTGLEIVEVYVNSEEVITEGTKVMKLSEESVAEARAELEQILKEADLAYRAGVIEYEQSKITAEYDRDSTLLSGEQAKAVYDETLSGLSASVEKAQEELDQVKADIVEYQSYVKDDSYASYFKVDEYKAIYDKTLNVLMSKMEEWGVSWPQVTGQGGGSMSSPSGGATPGGSSADTGMGGSSAGAGMSGAPSDSGMGSGSFGGDMGSGSFDGVMPVSTVSGGDAVYSPESGSGETSSEAEVVSGPTSDQIQVLASLYDVLELQYKDLEQAQNDYEDAIANAALELQLLELQLPELENALAEAEKNYKNQILQAELTYQTSLTNAQSTESDYETAIEQAETTFESLKNDWEDAKENLELFESSVGDGYFYASGNGTILRTMVRAGQNLSSESTVLMYSNPEEMTVTVSVDQSAIASIVLDDSVYIQSTEFGGFEGVVTEINPVSSSDSRTNVTYTVTVQFSGGESGIGANESVSVVFGMDSETIQSMISMSQGQMQGGFGGGQMLEGFDASQVPEGFGGGQMPEGFDASQMPEGFDASQMPECFGAVRCPRALAVAKCRQAVALELAARAIGNKWRDR